MFQQADVAAGPIFITEQRKSIVDFTAPFLTVQATLLMRKPPPGVAAAAASGQNGAGGIRSLGDLVNQSEIKYGTLARGIILRAFRRTNDTVLRIMWRQMQRSSASTTADAASSTGGGGGVLTTSNEEGIERVRRDKYAFILPDAIGEYVALRAPCDLVAVGRFLMKRGYGLAVGRHRSASTPQLLPSFNRALRALRKSGRLDRLRQRWWTEQSDCIRSSKVYSLNGAAAAVVGGGGGGDRRQSVDALEGPHWRRYDAVTTVGSIQSACVLAVLLIRRLVCSG